MIFPENSRVKGIFQRKSGYTMPETRLSMSGYHGTAQSRFKSIQREKFRLSSGDKEWLGPGIYFFAEYENAVWWAKGEARRRIKPKAGDPPFVIQVNLWYNENEHLDLDLVPDREQYELLVSQIESKLTRKPCFDAFDPMTARKLRRCLYCKLLFHSTPVKILSCTFFKEYNEYDIPINRKEHCVSGNDPIEIVCGKVV